MRKKRGTITMLLCKPALAPLYDDIQSNSEQVSNGGSYVYL